MRDLPALFLLAMAFLPTFLQAKCKSGTDLLIANVVVTGTQDLSSSELFQISSKLRGQCVPGDHDEIELLLRSVFQDRGYFGVTVKTLRINPDDPLAVPRPITLEAEVAEGPRYKLAEITFVGNHTFSDAKLRSTFPLKKGAPFSRANIAVGIDSVTKAYAADGFVDFWASVETQSLSDATMNLTLSINEGPQYRMGSFQVLAKKELAEKLEQAWQMPEGAIFDYTYVEKYIGENRSLLPMEFTPRHVQIVRDCPDALVSVRLPLDGTQPSSQASPKDVDCERPNGKTRTVSDEVVQP